MGSGSNTTHGALQGSKWAAWGARASLRAPKDLGETFSLALIACRLTLLFCSQHWEYQSTIDPEELFRKIFGDGGFSKSSFGDFAESQYGFGESQEVNGSNCLQESS